MRRRGREGERQVRIAEERTGRGWDGERQARDKSRAYLEKRRKKEEARRKRHELREEKKKNRRDRAPGFGGWLAAVISLGVAVLALGAIVTVGYFDLPEAKAGLYPGHPSAPYEFAELVDNMDVNLAKARVASGTYEMQKVRTDVLVESELAESCLASFPVDAHSTDNLAPFSKRVCAMSASPATHTSLR